MPFSAAWWSVCVCSAWVCERCCGYKWADLNYPVLTDTASSFRPTRLCWWRWQCTEVFDFAVAVLMQRAIEFRACLSQPLGMYFCPCNSCFVTQRTFPEQQHNCFAYEAMIKCSVIHKLCSQWSCAFCTFFFSCFCMKSNVPVRVVVVRSIICGLRCVLMDLACLYRDCWNY